MSAALSPDERAAVLDLVQRIETLEAYVGATIAPNNTFPVDGKPDWRAAHGGRLSSSLRQLHALLEEARAVRDGLMARAEASAGALAPLLGELATERARQDVQWGGPANDDQHDPTTWSLLLTKHNLRALNAARRPNEYRRALRNLAALALAALQAHDRRMARAEAKGGPDAA